MRNITLKESGVKMKCQQNVVRFKTFRDKFSSKPQLILCHDSQFFFRAKVKGDNIIFRGKKKKGIKIIRFLQFGYIFKILNYHLANK